MSSKVTRPRLWLQLTVSPRSLLLASTGHTRQGLRCRICKLNAHGDCAPNLPRCQPKQKLLRRQKSTSELENRVDIEEESEYFPRIISLLPQLQLTSPHPNPLTLKQSPSRARALSLSLSSSSSCLTQSHLTHSNYNNNNNNKHSTIYNNK